MKIKSILDANDSTKNSKLEDDKKFLINECGYTDISLEALSDEEVMRIAELRRISKSLIKKYHKVYEELS